MARPAAYRVLDLARWRTPASDYPDQQVGSVRIMRRLWGPGEFRMYGAAGWDRFRFPVQTPIVTLQENARGQWQDWMVDSPYEWYGLRDLARQCRGVTVTAGLGLGLVLHHLDRNPRVSRIVVVERNPHTIEMVAPLLPRAKPLEIVQGSLFDWIVYGVRNKLEADSFLVDISVGDVRDALVRSPMDQAYYMIRSLYPRAVRRIFGAQRYYDLLDGLFSRRRAEQRQGIGWCESCRQIVAGVRVRWPADRRKRVWACAKHGGQLIMESMLPDRS